MAVNLRGLKARGRYARHRLLLGRRPPARMTLREGPKELVLLVEAGALARALEVAERFAKTGGAAVVAALRQAVEEQAALLPPPPAPRPTRPRTSAETARADRPAGGIDWSQG